MYNADTYMSNMGDWNFADSTPLSLTTLVCLKDKAFYASVVTSGDITWPL